MTINHKFDGRALSRAIQALPAGQARMDALQDAIRKADRVNATLWRLLFRYDYAGQLLSHGDPPKAIPVSAEFSALYEEHPDILSDGGPDMYLMITQMAIDPIVSAPQIPMELWERLMGQFRELVRRFHTGLRTWYWQACRFYAYTDLDRARDCFEQFLKTERDIQSDCHACECNGAVWFALHTGDRARARELAQPILSGRLTCGDVPQATWLAFLEDDLDRGDLESALPLANTLHSAARQDSGSLSYFGAVLRCWAHCAPDQGPALLEGALPWALDIWDKRKQYDFWKGAWVFCSRWAGRQERMALRLTPAFPLYRADSAYRAEVLAEWFYQQAQGLAAQFDRRNGTDWYANNLAQANGGL